MDRKQSRHEKLPHRARCLPFGLRLRSLRSRLRLSNQFAAIEFITFFTGWTQSAFGPLFLGGVLGASLFWLFEFTSYFVTWFGRERNPEFVEECGYRASPLSQVDPWPCLLRLQSGFFRWCLLAPTTAFRRYCSTRNACHSIADVLGGSDRTAATRAAYEDSKWLIYVRSSPESRHGVQL